LTLSLDTRQVGRVTVVRCEGKIVGGGPSERLHTHVKQLLLDRRSILLHLGEVRFIDSSGLGAMVRALANARQARGELKLCNVTDPVRKLLKVTCLHTVFELHETEETALEAFYRPAIGAEKPASTGKSILCVDSNVDVLAYVRELLRGAGHEVQTAKLVNDARILMHVTHFDLLLVGADKVEAVATFRKMGSVPVIELGSEFSTRHAGEAGTELLGLIDARLHRDAVP
jgi:anti-sigma B factor antagonist